MLPRCHFVAMPALLLALGLGTAACGGADAKTVVIVQDSSRQPRLEFAGLRLLMSEGEARGWAADHSFTHNVDVDGAATQTASIQPHAHAVRRYDLKFENGRLISLTVHYLKAGRLTRRPAQTLRDQTQTTRRSLGDDRRRA